MTRRPGFRSHPSNWIFFQPYLLCFFLCYRFHVVRTCTHIRLLALPIVQHLLICYHQSVWLCLQRPFLLVKPQDGKTARARVGRPQTSSSPSRSFHCWPSQGGTSALSPLSCSFSFFLARLIAVVSTCLVCNSSIVATCPPIPAAHFAFRLCFIRFGFLVLVVVSGEPRQR